MQSCAMFSAVKRLGVMLSVTLMLVACQATSGTGTAVSCSGWRPITYSAGTDSEDTKRQILAHNQTGRRIGCW